MMRRPIYRIYLGGKLICRKPFRSDRTALEYASFMYGEPYTVCRELTPADGKIGLKGFVLRVLYALALLASLNMLVYLVYCLMGPR